jgi:hypothetical protein
MKQNRKHEQTDQFRRQGPGNTGSAYQAEEFINQVDQEATLPEPNKEGLTKSSSPGQSFQRSTPPFPVKDEDSKAKK